MGLFWWAELGFDCHLVLINEKADRESAMIGIAYCLGWIWPAILVGVGISMVVAFIVACAAKIPYGDSSLDNLLLSIERYLQSDGCVPDSEYVVESANTETVDDFDGKVSRARKDSEEKRRKRLKRATTRPTKSSATVEVFDRNPDVVAEVLLRAKGNCESCNSPTPFIRKSDNTPYLEVHHSIQLAIGGDDTVENAEALCPNCHREKHYGV